MKRPPFLSSAPLLGLPRIPLTRGQQMAFVASAQLMSGEDPWLQVGELACWLQRRGVSGVTS